MKTKLNTLTKIIPWLLGVLLSAAGMFLGYNFGSDIASFLGGEPGIWARLGKGFVWGGVIACLQWPVVRSVGVPPLWFIVASAVGFAVGYPFGQTIQAAFIHYWSLHWLGFWSATITFGLFLSVPQWLIFRRYFKHAGLWVLFSVAGWIFTELMWTSGGTIGIEFGIVTGFTLVWLVHTKSLNRKETEP
jgi:hypothetical protein